MRTPKSVRVLLLLWCTVALALAVLVGCGEVPATNRESSDGQHQATVTLEGGSGRASIASPTTVTIEDGKATATIEWSSPNYDYMIVDGKRYLPTNDGGNSTFDIPVPAFDEPFDVIADTTAMSVPHEIEYQITVEIT
jgi:hypothetical protein